MDEPEESFLWVKNRKEKILFTGIIFIIIFFVLVGIGIIGLAFDLSGKFFMALLGFAVMSFGIGSCLWAYGFYIANGAKKIRK